MKATKENTRSGVCRWQAVSARALLLIASMFQFFCISERAGAGVWYEPFASPPYSNNKQLGTGAGIWGLGNSPGGGSPTVSNVANLTYSGLVTTPNTAGLVCVTNISSSNRQAHTNFTASVTGSALVPGPGTNIYLSLLLRVEATPSANRQVCGLSTATSSTPGSSMVLGLDGGGRLLIGKNISPGAFPGAGTDPLNVGETYLVVMRYTWASGSANDSVDLWLNPTPGSGESSPQISTTANSDITAGFQTFAAYSAGNSSGGLLYGSGSGLIWLDEIRVGTNWSDVTPSGGCNPATVTAPGDKTGFVGETVQFSVSAGDSSGPAFQWQESTDGNNWFDAIGAVNSASYTTPALNNGDNLKQYRCIVTVACDGTSATSSPPAVLTVIDGSVISYRSVNSGDWNNPGTWEQSNDGNNWSPATTTPSFISSNITVRSGNTVFVTAPVTADDLTIESGGQVSANGATFTINDGAATLDCDVSGTLQADDVAGSSIDIVGAPGIQFENGGRYVWAASGVTAVIPVANWGNGSTCEIQNCGNATPIGLNQTFYDFYWNRTSPGKADLGGQLTYVLHDLKINASGDPANSVRFLMVSGTCNLIIGNDLVLEGGYTTLSGGSTPNTVVNIYIGHDMTINGGATLDSRNSGGETSSANFWFTSTDSPHVLTKAGGINHTGDAGGTPINWHVGHGTTLTLSSGNLDLYPASTNLLGDSVVVDGTFNCNGNQIAGLGDTGTLTVNAGGELTGSGTSQIASGLRTLNFDGTLNLPGLPSFSGGEGLTLFGATTYNITSVSIVPSTPPGGAFTWDTTQLGTTGTLYVSGGGGGSNLKITKATPSGTDLTLTGSGGTANAGFTVLTSSSLTTPRGSWNFVTFGNFDNNGDFSITFTVPVSPAFFIIQQ